MKHRLYEGWIIARDDLSPDQERELHLHLKKCEACNTLAMANQALERSFSSVQMVEPMPGFTQRWRARANAKRTLAYRRQTSLILGLLSSGTTVLLMPLMLQVIMVLLSPEDLLVDYAQGAGKWLAWLGFLGEIVITFLTTLTATVPVVWWLLMAVFIAGVCVLWGFSLHRFGFIPRRKGV